MILIIDDDPDIVQTLKGNLELDGYEVMSGHDGRTGLNLARSQRPELIVLDLSLPDIDGVRVCQILRREFEFPIIMLTARDSISDKVLGLESGADDYLVKPFHFLELSARIKVVFKRLGRDPARTEFISKDLCINFQTRSVTVNSEDAKLTRTEFNLLELFAAYPGQTLARSFIENQLWRDSQLYQSSRVIDVHVQRLRKKIESDPEKPEYIITVAGVGYRFQGE